MAVLFCFTSGNASFCQSNGFDHGNNQGAKTEIADAVYEVEGKSRCDPGQHPVEIQTKEQSLRRSVQNAVQKSVCSIEQHIHNGGRLWGKITGEQHDGTPQRRP